MLPPLRPYETPYAALAVE